jgi:hypothetical protein
VTKINNFTKAPWYEYEHKNINISVKGKLIGNIQNYEMLDNYRHFVPFFVRLFLCSPIHPFKHLIILNVTNQLTFDGNINIFMLIVVPGSLCKVVDFCH